MPKSQTPPASVLLHGSVPFTGFSTPPVIRWHLTLTAREGTSQFFIDSLRFKIQEAGSGEARVGVDELRHAFNAIAAQVRPELQRHLERVDRAARRASMRGFDYAPYRSWIEQLPPIHQRLTILRDEHERRVRSGELVTDKATLSIGELSEQSGVATSVILELETSGLLNPARSEGGQRRYLPSEIARIKELARGLGEKSRKLHQDHVPDDPSPVAAMSTRSSQRNRSRPTTPEFEPSQIKDMTVATVAELYLEACERFPNRDHSVVEYIQKHMNWLSENYIITMIRLARRRGIALPVYRRGRLPKKVTS
ncbi:MAG: MerR family transcriptional regulator [Ilumatobacteraceae bacterium]